MFKTTPIALALTALLAACGAAPADNLGTSSSAIVDSDEIAFIFSLSPEARTGTVEFVNDSKTTREKLDDECKLHSDAAKKIDRFKRRKGGFADIYELADVTQVGVWNLSKVVDCATDNGFIVVTAPPVVTVTLTETFSDLDPALQTVVNALIVEAQAQADDNCRYNYNWCYPGTFSFYSAEITHEDGTPVSYAIRIGRTIDLGITESVDYTLDADFNVLDAYWDAG